MRRTFKYRLWTNANQERELGIMLETHRRLYNYCLDMKELAYLCFRNVISYSDQQKWFTKQRQIDPYYARLTVQSAQATIARLDRAYLSFFRRVKQGTTPGYPKFKSRDRFNSFSYASYGNGIKLAKNKLTLQYVGIVRVNLHRPVQGKIKTTAIKREAGKWYVYFSCDLGDVQIPPSNKPMVGIDVGLESFLVTSNGEREANPKYLKTALPELRVKSRSLSRKKRGGTNRNKAQIKVAKLHARIKNIRREHHTKVARKVVRRYGFIAVERLNIKEMIKNGRFSRSIGDVAWGNFTGTLKHQANKSGAMVVEVDPKGTSQLCSRCFLKVPKDLSVRWHDCANCKLSVHRDLNAARNILVRGLVGTPLAGLNVDAIVKRAPRSRVLRDLV